MKLSAAKKPRALSRTERERYVLERYEKQTTTETADHLGISKEELYSLAKKFGLKVKVGVCRPFTEEEDAFLRANYKRLSVHEIGKAINRSHRQVSTRAAKLGLGKYTGIMSGSLLEGVDKRAFKEARKKVCDIFEEMADCGTPEQTLILKIILQTIKDLGTRYDAVCVLCGGGLEWHFESVGILPEYAYKVISRSGIITPEHRRRMGIGIT